MVPVPGDVPAVLGPTCGTYLGGDNLVLVTAAQDLGQQLVAEAACDFCQKHLALGRRGGLGRVITDL